MTRRPSTIAVSFSKARMPSRCRAFEKMASRFWRRATPLRPWSMPVASAASRMSVSVSDAYQTSRRRMLA